MTEKFPDFEPECTCGPADGVQAASRAETQHLRFRRRQLSAAVARRDTFRLSYFEKARSSESSKAELAQLMKQVDASREEVARQRDILEKDPLVQRYEKGPSGESFESLANDASSVITNKYFREEPLQGVSWNNYFTRYREAQIDGWKPRVLAAKSPEEIAQREELEKVHKYSEKELRPLREQKEAARRRERALYPEEIVKAEVRQCQSPSAIPAFPSPPKGPPKGPHKGAASRPKAAVSEP